MLYLEAKDFHRLLTQWNASEERRRWLKSDNATVLSESRLLQRLIQAQEQFATVAGLPVEMSLVNELAGAQSAFAFYDFSKVHFVYVTRLEGPRLDQSTLWKSRSGYQTRDVAGIPFYTKTQTEGRDSYTVAFASHNGWLIVATDPTLMASTLALLSGQAGGSVSNEAWYTNTVKQVPAQGDLRLVYNLAVLRKTPQFRTYWIQRNLSELAAFTSGSADLFEQPSGFEERRVLVHSSPAEASGDNASINQALAHIPPGASLYRAWRAPNREAINAVLQQVILGDSAVAPDQTHYAPEVSPNAPTVGSDSDLETRIDQPGFKKSADNNLDDVTDAIMAMQPLALLHSQMTRVADDQVFVVPESEVTIVCGKPDREKLSSVLQNAVSITKTGPLDPLRTLVESNAVVLSRLAPHSFLKPPVALPGETYAAVYEHSAEWPRYKRLFRLVDRGTADAPTFFSGNIRSLGDSLYRLRRASIATQEEGAVIRDTVRSEFLPK
jgi:hypothetical protein